MRIRKLYFLTALFLISLNGIALAQDGQLDKSFNTTGNTVVDIGSHDEAHQVLIQNDGKIVVIGFAYITADNANVFALARFDANGKLDDSFGKKGIVTTAIGPSDARAYAGAIQSDGKIIAAGYSSPGGSGSQRVFTLVRYNSNGSPDRSFGKGGIVTTAVGKSDDRIYSVALQGNGKIVAAGTTYLGALSNGDTHVFSLARYNMNGSLDSSFGRNGIIMTAVQHNTRQPEDDEAHSVVIQKDGKIVVAGTAGNGVIYMLALARYNPNGSLDKSFGPGGAVLAGVNGIQTSTIGLSYDNQAYAAVIQKDGKIDIAGYAGNQGQYVFALARFKPDGKPDRSFGTNGFTSTNISHSDDAAYALAIQNDGKIVLAGHTKIPGFMHYDFALVRYNSNGSIDKSFGSNGVATAGFGLKDDKAYTLLIQKNGNIVEAGTSLQNSFYDTYAIGIARFLDSK